MSQIGTDLAKKTLDSDLLQNLGKSIRVSMGEIAGTLKESIKSYNNASHEINFQGLQAFINSNKDTEINLSGIHQIMNSHISSELNLENKLKDLESKIQKIKHKFKHLIEFAGDIKIEEIHDIRNFALSLIKYKELFEDSIEFINEGKDTSNSELKTIVDNAVKEEILKEFIGINLENGKKVKISQKETTELINQDGINLNIGGISIQVTEESELAKTLNKNIAYSELLLQYWSSRCIEGQTEENKFFIYKNRHPKGIAVSIEGKNYSIIGFFKENQIFECTKTYPDGSKMIGKIKDGVMFGTGSLRFNNEGVFTGTIFENFTAEGKITNGNILKVGSYKITKVENTITFENCGYCKFYKNERLFKEGVIEGNEFNGTIYRMDGTIEKGKWVNGENEFCEISKNDETTYIKRTPTPTTRECYRIKKKNKGILIHKFVKIDGKIDGDAYFCEGLTRKWIKFNQGEIYSIRTSEPTMESEYSIKDGKKYGNGYIKCSIFSYKGDFCNDEFHGFGIYEQNDPKLKFSGEYIFGKYKCGTLETDNFTYKGAFDSSNRFHGSGELIKSDSTYTGYFLNGNPHEQGILIRNNGEKFDGNFENGRLVNGSIVTKEFTYTGNIKDGLFNGHGKLMKDDLILEGDFMGGNLKFGKILAPGFTYSGECSNGRPHGQGTLIEKDIEYQGLFEDGTLIKGTYFKNGTSYPYP